MTDATPPAAAPPRSADDEKDYGMKKRGDKHKTSHAATADEQGRVLVMCECGWRDTVDVTGLSWQEGMAKIFEARDAHEAAGEKR